MRTLSLASAATPRPRRVGSLLLVLVTGLAGACSAPDSSLPQRTTGDPMTEASLQLERLFADAWDFQMRESPLYATAVGDHRFNDQLGGVSAADQERRVGARREFLARLDAVDLAALMPEERVSAAIFRRQQAEAVEDFELRAWLIPITNREGFHTSFPQLPDRVPLATVRDYENYVARLADFRRYAAEHTELMRTGVAEGWTLPRVVLEGIDETLRPHIVDAAEASLLWAPLARFPDAVPAAERTRLEGAARESIMTSVVPAYQDFLRFMEEEYLPAARTTIGASELPSGHAYYAQRVRSFTTLDLTPEQVHEQGLAEVARIRAEMDEVIRSTGFDGSFEAFVRFLRTDPRFYARAPGELMREVAYVLKRMDGELPRLFRRLPRMSYGIQEIPAFIAPRTTTAYYSRPAGDGTRSGTYWVNTYDLPSRPLYEVEALSLHEAVPGHHLQIAIQQELEGLPDFRRFSGFTAFTEGWGLYAERLGLEVGFYTDPYSDFGRLTYEMWRACRLVVDTGMHALGWTRQQAIDYMAANTALTLLNITNEVDRYIAWPGQALAYKTGELKIRELRALAESELGARFDVRAFHDVVLASGAVPLDVLEETVRGWIAGGGG